MAISYPISLPTTGVASVEWRTVNAATRSQSPFTYKQQIIAHGGQRWEATVNLRPMRRAEAAAWRSALISLKGPIGTFYLSDPLYCSPRGTLALDGTVGEAATNHVTGTAGDSFITVAMGDNTKTLLAGDYISVGSGANKKLYQVLEDLTGDGTVEVWPDLRTDYSSAGFATNSAEGVFRLANNVTSWSIDNAAIYGISFEVVEAITG